MTEHGGHALAAVVVVYGQRLVRARRRHVLTAAIEGQLDQGPVVAGRAFESPAGIQNGSDEKLSRAGGASGLTWNVSHC